MIDEYIHSHTDGANRAYGFPVVNSLAARADVWMSREGDRFNWTGKCGRYSGG